MYNVGCQKYRICYLLAARCFPISYLHALFQMMLENKMMVALKMYAKCTPFQNINYTIVIQQLHFFSQNKNAKRFIQNRVFKLLYTKMKKGDLY